MKTLKVYLASIFIVGIMWAVITFIIILLFPAGLNRLNNFVKGKEVALTANQNVSKDKVFNVQMNEMLYRSDAVILAMKYKLDGRKVFGLLIDEDENNTENTKSDPIITGNGNALRERLRQRSEKYSIPLNIVASILIDLKMMNCSQRIAEWE